MLKPGATARIPVNPEHISMGKLQIVVGALNLTHPPATTDQVRPLTANYGSRLQARNKPAITLPATVV